MPEDDTVCMIVDDAEFDRRMMRQVIRKTYPDMPMVVAKSLDEARRRLKGRKISIMFLDNSLPDGLGVDFVAELNGDPAHRKVPVVIVSDFPSPFMYAKAKARNVCEVWSKSEFLTEKVQHVVERHALAS